MTQYITILFVSLCFSAFFSAAETAYTALTYMQISIIKSKYTIRANLIEKIYNRPSLFLGSILIGNNVANFIFSVESTQLALAVWGNQSLALFTGLMIFVILMFGEITPKNLAILNNQRFILTFIYPCYFFYLLFYPISYIFSLFSNLLHKFSKSDPNISNASDITLNNFIKLFYHAKDSGSLDPLKAFMVTRLLSLSELSIDQIITHRKDIVSISSNLQCEEVSILLKGCIYSKIPVYLNDEKEHIVGIIKKHDAEIKQTGSLHDLIIKPVFVTENKKIEEVLEILRKEKQSIAIVLDEYGGLHGLVTLEDIMSFIFDETKSLQQESNKEIIKLTQSKYLLKGTAPISKICEILAIPIPKTIESRTVSGYLSELTGDILRMGDLIETDFGTMNIASTQNHRVDTVIWFLNENSENALS